VKVKVKAKGGGMVTFALHPPDSGQPPTGDPHVGFLEQAETDVAGGDAAAVPVAMGGVLLPPQVPYGPDPGTYTQLWVSQTSTTTREELIEDLSCYLTAFTVSGRPDYVAIQNTIVSSADWYGFLTILPDNQVCIIHSLGRHYSGLGKQTQEHNRFYRLLGEKVGDQLPPLVMVPSTGLIPWLKMQDLTPPTEDSLQGLEQGSAKTVLKTLGTEDEAELPTVSVQNMCYVSKPWAAHFLAP
jgi:hypothetical protein